MTPHNGKRSKAKALLVTVALVAGMFSGTTASLAEPAAPPGGAPARAPPGRPQTDVPAQANRPARHAPCVRGTAFIEELEGHEILETGAFDCNRVDLMSFLTVDEIGGGFAVGTGRGSDVWGWSDPQTRREYAIVGLEVGTSFIDITDPKRPVFLAHLPTAATNFLIWRDIKVFQDHAFIVAESANHGMQVFDLTKLRDLDAASAPHTVAADARYTGFLRAHNIEVNEDSGFAYAVGQRDDAFGCISSMHMIDIRNPTEPAFAGCYEDDGYIHDTHCVTYDGPDTRFTGREICVGSSHPPSPPPEPGNRVVIVDVTDKADPVTLARAFYPNPSPGISHQGRLLDGHQFYLHGHEAGAPRDPQGIDIFDMSDLTDPQHIGFFESPEQSTHHNLYQRGRYVFQSNYTSGLRVYDTRKVAEGVLEEVAHFDVFPPNNDPGFGFGTWSNFPLFRSGVVAVHGYQGLWIVRPRLGRS
jgi:choice-of-anchor B domain-containing protein